MRVIGYVRVSTEEQAVSGAGLEAQRRAIVADARGGQANRRPGHIDLGPQQRAVHTQLQRPGARADGEPPHT